MDWRIYYGDGSIFSSDDGAWKDAPGWDVQVVIFRDPESGWAMRHQGDFYRLDSDGSVVSMDYVGMLDWVINLLGLKAGRMLSTVKWKQVYDQAKDDMTELQRGTTIHRSN